MMWVHMYSPARLRFKALHTDIKPSAMHVGDALGRTEDVPTHDREHQATRDEDATTTNTYNNNNDQSLISHRNH